MFLEKEGEELVGKRCILSSENSFIERFADSGFKTKWSGFWSPPYKYMDYYAYKVNGNWLSHDNIQNFMVQPGVGIWDHLINGLKIRDYVFVWKNSFLTLLEIKNKSNDKKAVSVCMEAAFDFRSYDKDISNAKYNTEFSETRASLKITDRNSDLAGMIGKAKSGKGKVEWEMEEKYRDHYPQERQMCYIPGTYRIKMEIDPGESIQVPFAFTFSDNGDPREEFDTLMSSWSDILIGKTQSTSQEIKGEVHTPNEGLNEAFRWSKLSLRDLIFSYDMDYLFAGLPWFQNEWGRDTLWAIFGFLECGDFEFVRKQLKILFKKRKDRIPNKIGLSGDLVYNGADTDPLFLILARKYRDYTGKNLWGKKTDAHPLEIFSSLNTQDNRVIHKSEETWMDTLERGNSAIEIQALWLEAAKLYGHEGMEELEKGLKQYWNEDSGFMYDSFEEGSPIVNKTINCAVPLMFGQIDDKKAIKLLEVIGGEFTTQHGVRTRSCLEEDYSPDIYHKGAIWYLSTLWSACANLEYGRIKEGISLLEKTAEEIYNNQLGAISECISAKTGDILGCTNQAWSNALFIHAIDSYLFGLKPNLKDKVLKIDPKIPEGWERAARMDKKIGDNKFDFKVERESEKLKIALNFDRNPSIRLEVPDRFEAEVNGRKIEKAQLNKENIIELKFSRTGRER